MIKQASVGKGEKMEALYEYLTGNQFKNRIENIVMAFTSMKNDLDTEKRAFQKMWSKREKEIERVTSNTLGMYGDLQGIAGANALPRVESLELDAGEEESNVSALENAAIATKDAVTQQLAAKKKFTEKSADLPKKKTNSKDEIIEQEVVKSPDVTLF